MRVDAKNGLADGHRSGGFDPARCVDARGDEVAVAPATQIEVTLIISRCADDLAVVWMMFAEYVKPGSLA
jgi:hypothetical protein